jgi:cysteine desulfurase/selenocysteine lyase
MSFDLSRIRADFPILSRQVNNKPLVYLDNGASAQKPQVVIDAVTQAYSSEYANVHRGLHYLSNLATDKYEAVRGKLARFLNAASEEHIVLNSGTTEGINLVALAGPCRASRPEMRSCCPLWSITPILSHGIFCVSGWV